MAKVSHHEPVIGIKRPGRVAIVRLNRPKTLNALNEAVINGHDGGAAAVGSGSRDRRDNHYR